MSTSIKPKLRKKKQPVIATDRTLGKIRIFGSPSKTSVVFEIPGAALNLGLWRARGTTHGPPLDHGRAQDAWLRDARAAGPSEQGSVGNGGTTHEPPLDHPWTPSGPPMDQVLRVSCDGEYPKLVVSPNSQLIL